MKVRKHRTEKTWLETRRKLIGSSDAASIAGLFEEGGFGDDRYTLWARKTGKISGIPGSLRFEVGHFLEDFIAAKAAEELGVEVEDPGDYTIFLGEPWQGATLDRKIIAPAEGILELKTVSSHVAKDWPNLYVKLQLVHQALCTGIEDTWAAGLIGLGESLIIHDFSPSMEMRERLYELEYRFWHDHIKPDIPPPIGKGDRSKETLLQMFPESVEAKRIDLSATDAVVHAAQQYRKRKQQQKELKKALRLVEKDLTAHENVLKEQMGDAELADLPGAKYKWASHERAGYTVDTKTIRTFKEVKK